MVAYKLPGTPMLGAIEVKRLLNGMWVSYDSPLTFRVQTSDSGSADIFENMAAEKAGVYTFKLVESSLGAESAPITVTISKMQTAFALSATSIKGEFTSTHKAKGKNTLYYAAETDTVVSWPCAPDEIGSPVTLQRLSSSKWVSEDQSEPALLPTDGNSTQTWAIKQKTAEATSYRLYVAPSDYVTGGTSDTFTVTGEQRSPKISVKYSASTQRLNKTAVKMTVTAKGLIRGKVRVYDGGKLLSTVTMSKGTASGETVTGKVTYTLPKSLKKGAHKIKVKFTPTAEYVGFYAQQTSKATKITVK
ncbi:MAG: hypothetical protein LBR32_09865 [Propionibacteriaceae bacterium]|nr:hypothetical protein [Propionibacteriaceae bacterium]